MGWRGLQVGITVCRSVWLVQRAKLGSHTAGQGGPCKCWVATVAGVFEGLLGPALRPVTTPPVPENQTAAPVHQKGLTDKPQPCLPSSPGGSQDALSLSSGPRAKAMVYDTSSTQHFPECWPLSTTNNILARLLRKGS